MSRYLDCACYVVLGIVLLVAASTFGIAFIEYREAYNEFVEDPNDDKGFHADLCRDTLMQAKYPRLKRACHESMHSAFDDARSRALKAVLSRWAVCDANGCDAFLNRFGRYFSVGALLFALAIGAWCILLVYRVSARREIERLPEAIRRN